MKAILGIVAITLGAVALPASAQIDFSTDFEGTTGVSKDGWLGVVNYFTDTACANYGSTPYSFEAADDGVQVSNLVDSGGSQKLNFFSNYDDAQQASSCIETIILKEKTLTADDVGSYTFYFESEDPGLGATTATAFVKLAYAPIAGTPTNALPAGDKSISVEITNADVGKLLQWGFSNTSYNYQPTGMYYDNVCFGAPDQCPAASSSGGSSPSNSTAIPVLPLWALFGLAGLIGLMGLRRKA
jgi:hypothetical protein